MPPDSPVKTISEIHKEEKVGELQPIDRQELRKKVEAIRIKSQEKMLERHKHAQMEREYQLKCNERGQPLLKPPPKLNFAEVQKKINEKVIEVRQEKKEKPLMLIDIDIGGGKKDRLTVMKTDSPRSLSHAFCSKHNLDDGTRDHLVIQISQRIQQVLNRQKKKEQKPKKAKSPEVS